MVAEGGGLVCDVEPVAVTAVHERCGDGGGVGVAGEGEETGVVGVAVDAHAEGGGEVLAVEEELCGVGVAESHFAEFEGHVLDGGDEVGRSAGRGRCARVKGFAAAVAPEVVGQGGIVDERVAVVLNLVDGLVAVDFFLGDGVLAVPLHQQVDGPCVECGVEVLVDHVGVAPAQVLIGCGHVEVGAGEVALVLVGGLEDILSAAALAGDGIADGGYAVLELDVLGAVNLAEGIVGFGGVGAHLGGVEVVEVDVGADVGEAAPP